MIARKRQPGICHFRVYIDRRDSLKLESWLVERKFKRMRLRDVKQKGHSSASAAPWVSGAEPVALRRYFDAGGAGAYICVKANDTGASLHGIVSC
jgi:hypothetical protein